MTQELLRYFRFDAWANAEAARSLRTLGRPSERAVALLAHIAAAQQLWLDRVRAVPQSVAVWPSWTVEETEARLSSANQGWVELLQDEDLAREVAYKNSKGESYESTAGDIALHVVFHGVYHRGQIAALVRGGGGEPAYTDFIHGVRQGKLAPR